MACGNRRVVSHLASFGFGNDPEKSPPLIPALTPCSLDVDRVN